MLAMILRAPAEHHYWPVPAMEHWVYGVVYWISGLIQKYLFLPFRHLGFQGAT